MAASRRWPACAMAVLFLGYAAGKAVFAVQGRLGFPGGPPAAGDYFLDPALAQWLAAASGVLGAGIAIATLRRAVPLPVLIAMLLAVLGGAGIMVVDGFVGVGIGWRWYHGVVGLLAAGCSLAMTWACWRGRVASRSCPRGEASRSQPESGVGADSRHWTKNQAG